MSAAEIVARAFKVAALASQKGYAVAAGKGGNLRFVTVVYDKRGKSTVTPHTEWLTPAEALEIVQQ